MERGKAGRTTVKSDQRVSTADRWAKIRSTTSPTDPKTSTLREGEEPDSEMRSDMSQMFICDICVDNLCLAPCVSLG